VFASNVVALLPILTKANSANWPLLNQRGFAMAQASASIDIPAPPDQVWQLIGGFNSLPDWLPQVHKSELSEGGRVRHLANPDGETIIERLEAFDNAGRSYSYSILNAPFPVAGYQSTLCVQEMRGGKGSRVKWFGQFVPKGVSDQEASRLFQGFYEEGLKALAARLQVEQGEVASAIVSLDTATFVAARARSMRG
jgi:hypothetical protein